MRPPSPGIRWLAAVAAATLLGALTPAVSIALAPAAQAAQLQELSVDSTQLASGLSRPTAIMAPDDGSDRLLITEKPGTIRVYHPDTGLSETPLLDISDRVDTSGTEQGLLGIATAPDFTQNPALYLAYTAAPDGTLTLSRFPLSSPGQTPVDASQEEVLLTQEHAEFANHNGGHLAFDAQGLLYWSLGDGGGSGDPFDSGQDPTTLLGTILRLDVSQECGDLHYCIPQDNPFVGDPEAREEIWTYGLRNAWRFSFDPADDSLWIADVGQGSFEEVNHLAPNQGGANMGWSCMEGPEVFDSEQCAPEQTLVDPVFWYETSVEGCAVIGGHVYRGADYADVATGTYVTTDYCTGTTWGIQADGGSYTSAEIGELPFQTTSIGVDTDGELYGVTDLPGQLYALSFEGEPGSGPGGEENCAVDYSTNDWNGGFTASVRITNTGADPIENWELEFAFPSDQTVQQGWSAQWSQQGATVTATSAAWNSTIAPGQTVEIGFNGSWSGANPPPQSFALNGAECAIE